MSKDNPESSTALVKHVQPSVVVWTGAAGRGREARAERQRIIADVLKEGQDFGTIPGVSKKCLLKPGAEKITDSLELYPDYEAINVIEDFDKPLFFYRYRCLLRQRGSDLIVATGIGSCNSMEDRYRWRKAERTCPTCQKATIIKGKKDYGGGWLCYVKKGGCGAKFKDGDAALESQTVGKVPNPDLHTQVNTIDKMAQKRALVAANLNLGFSDQFTQDVEDLGPDADDEPPQEERPVVKEAEPTDPIPEKERRRIFARWKERAEEMKIPKTEVESRLKAIILSFGYDSTTKIVRGDLDKILDAIDSYDVADVA